jgi:hypothetical protein
LSNRTDPWGGLIQRGLMSRGAYLGQTEPIKEWDTLSQIHSLGRNNCVVFILMHLKIMQNIGLIISNSITAQAAIWQMSLPARSPLPVPSSIEAAMKEAGLNEQERNRIKIKCFTTQDAHCLPCQISIDGKPIQNFLNPISNYLEEYAHLNGQFAVVHRMPALFNEADSHAELNGLIQALEAACRFILSQKSSSEKEIQYSVLLDAFNIYADKAKHAMLAAANTNKMLSQRETTVGEKIYRSAKANLLFSYANHTEKQKPEYLIKSPLVKLFSQQWGA